ncbi:V-type ATP synthase subunit A [Trichloromonas sp.]|uniref:V-type ATP synthase subunit A n=1 Tax=Trichloromonas sp. TaxID=3069249 RepID=UPI003D814E6C
MSGRIIGISGPTVSVDLPGLRLYDRVQVGHARLLGEVVRLEHRRATVQVYENTRGLGLGEPVTGVGLPLTVRLGPALLNRMFDGLQRNLDWLYRQEGDFIHAGKEPPPLEIDAPLEFTPLKQPGDFVATGEDLGTIQEGPFKHFVRAAVSGTVQTITTGPFDLHAPVATLEDGQRCFCFEDWPVRKPRPYRRKLPLGEPLVTGQRCVDFLFPLARGGTAIFPGGFGTGKTILEQTIAKFAAIDIVIYVGCGERGNEMAEMLEEFTALDDPWSGKPLMARTIVVVNTSNMPVAAREASIYTAVTMGEYYRDMGYHVLLLADSLSRWAEALREISSALEEMPGEEGYPTYLASRLAEFFARAGAVETLSGKIGSLSMILSISPPGGDFTEPVTQACLRTTGSFLMLDTALAHRRHFPAINWFQSFSLYAEVSAHFNETTSPRWDAVKQECRQLLQKEEGLREVAEIVGTEGLQDGDRLLMKVAETIRQKFLSQNAYSEDAFSTPEQTFEKISGMLEFYRCAGEKLKQGKFLDEILKDQG